MARKSNYEMLLSIKERRLEGLNYDIERYKKWITDLLKEDDSTIILNLGAYSGKLIGALSNRYATQGDLYEMKDWLGEQNENVD